MMEKERTKGRKRNKRAGKGSKKKKEKEDWQRLSGENVDTSNGSVRRCYHFISSK